MLLRFALPLALIAAQVPAQGLVAPAFVAPTRAPAASTADEMSAIRRAVALYDQGKFDAAIAIYEPLLAASPDNATVMYELAMSYVATKNYQRAIDIAAKGTTYQVPLPVLAQFYGLIGNSMDDAREPKRAIEVYQKGLEFAPTAGLYYNMGLTYAQSLTDVPNAKAALKNGARLDPSHASTQLMLGRLFLMDDLKVASFFALSRFLILEPATPRTGDAYQMWFRLLNGGVTVSAADNQTHITINQNQPKDEGDLAKLDLHLSLSKAVSMNSPGERTPVQRIVDQLSQLFSLYGGLDPGDDKGTFVWTYYMPFMVEMQKKNFVEPFVYYVSQRTDLVGVREWLAVNRERVLAFLEWAKAYPFPKPAR